MCLGFSWPAGWLSEAGNKECHRLACHLQRITKPSENEKHLINAEQRGASLIATCEAAL